MRAEIQPQPKKKTGYDAITGVVLKRCLAKGLKMLLLSQLWEYIFFVEIAKDFYFLLLFQHTS